MTLQELHNLIGLVAAAYTCASGGTYTVSQCRLLPIVMFAWICFVHNSGPFNPRTLVGTTGIIREVMLYLTRCMGLCNICI